MRRPPLPVRIVAAVVVLALGLVGLLVREGMARAQGQEVRLAITGYDPRSLLTGHYVQFRLQDVLPQEQACRVMDKRLEGRPTGWFALRREGASHRIVGMAEDRATALRLGDTAVRGETACYGMVLTRQPNARAEPGPSSVSLGIGVDRIHLEQDEAEALEKVLQGRDGPPSPSWAVVSVGPDGKARLKGLIVGDRRVDLDWF